ncbi:hypothetical protein MKX01_014233 [Papaver californicum]|nr:hypothetical protein MKX01_014233 [Papaver californicum]
MSEPIEVDDQPPPSFSQNKIVTLVNLKLKVATSICGSVEKCCVIWRKVFNPDRLPRFIRGCTETTRIYHFWPGKNSNYRFYLMFTTSALIFFIFIFAFSCRKINRRMLETRLGFFRTISSCPEAFALASFCSSQCGLFTAYENLRRRHVGCPNPYNKGILRNIKDVCFVRLPFSRVDFRAEATSQMCHGGGGAGQLQL